MGTTLTRVETLTQVETPLKTRSETNGHTPRRERSPAVLLPVVESLPTARGLYWKDGFRGHLNTGEGVAQVRLDATGGIRIRMKVDRRSTPSEALVLNASLPANLRVAGPAHRRCLLADVWPDASGFSRSLSEIRQGIRRNAGGTRKGRRPPPGDAGPYEHVFDQLRNGKGSRGVAEGSLDVVDREPGWELGLRVRGGRVAVRVSPERSGLRLYRIVLKGAELSAVESGPGGRSVSDMALRLNERLRLVRLARIDAGLVVEARLSRALTDVERVVETARAIAVVSAAVRTPLWPLTQIESVARCYADVFNLPHGEAQE